MAEGQVDRGVVFVLKVAADKGAEKTLRRFGEQISKSQERADQSAVASAKRRTIDILRQQEAEAKEAERAVNKKLAAERRLTIGILKDREKLARETEKARKQEELSRVTELKKAQRNLEDVQTRMASGSLQVKDSLFAAVGGVTKLAGGFVKLGLAGEEDLAKLVRGLVKLQGAMDVLNAGVQLYRNLTTAVKAYRQAVLAATVAEEAAALVRAKSAGLGVTGAIGVGAGVGGVGRSVAGGAAGAAGVGIVGRALAGVTIGAKAATAALLSVPGAIAAAVLGVGAAAIMASNIGGARDWAAQQMAAGGRMAPGTISGGLMGVVSGRKWTRIGWPVGWLAGGPGTKAAQRAALAEQERSQQMRRELTGQQLRAETVYGFTRMDLAEQSELAEVQRQARLRDMNPRQAARFTRRQAAAQWQEVGGLQARRAELLSAGTTPQAMAQLRAETEAAQQEAVSLSQQAIDAAEKRLRHEKDISSLRREAVERAIAGAKEELTIRKQAIEQERQRLLTAEERFGQLDPLQQQRLIRLAQQARTGGQLSVQQWQALRGVGTRQMEEMASQAFRQRARQAGFRQAFGFGERERLAQLRTERQQLRITLDEKRDLRVQIEQNTDQIVRELSDFINQEMNRRDRVIVQQIQQRYEAQQEQMARQYQQRLTAQNVAAG